MYMAATIFELSIPSFLPSPLSLPPLHAVEITVVNFTPAQLSTTTFILSEKSTSLDEEEAISGGFVIVSWAIHAVDLLE
ncbi:hypothetical protein ACET3Z_013711 [Daucus carota]